MIITPAKPIQEKVHKAFVHNINNNIWVDKLPSINALSNEFKVNTKTLRKVIDRLAENGMVDVRHGLGTFICSRGKSDIKQAERILLVAPYMRRYFISTLVNKFIDYHNNHHDVDIMAVGYDDNYFENSLPEMLVQFNRVAILLPKRISPRIKRCLNEFSLRGRLLILNARIAGVKSMVVTGDNLMSGELAVSNLHALGCHDIAFLKYGSSRKVNLRLRGYKRGIEKLEKSDQKIVSYQMSKVWMNNYFRKMIEDKELPEAIIFDFHPAAALARLILCQINPALAKKVKFMTFDPDELVQEMGGVAMVQPFHEIVETSVNLLTAKTWKCKTINIRAEFIDYDKQLIETTQQVHKDDIKDKMENFI